MASKGIDYGLGTTNIDRKNGIRYGVIPINDVCQAWCDSSELIYPEPEPCQCETCGGSGEVERNGRADPSRPDNGPIMDECLDCDGTGSVVPDVSDSCCEPIGSEYNSEGYRASAGEGDIFITKSPFYTRASFCSPCAPGACHLRSPNPDGEKCYCFGHDWFEEGKAPYPVFRVSDDTEVFLEPDRA